MATQTNHFVLKGDQTEITYDDTSLDGQPQLTYQALPDSAQTFCGDQIRSEVSEIGRLLTVTLAAVADGDTTLLTLLLPAINSIGPTVYEFKTIAILTTVRGSIGGPVLLRGPVQSYQVVQLEGEAQPISS